MTELEVWAEELCHRALSHHDAGGSRTAQAMVALAEEHSPGSWKKYLVKVGRTEVAEKLEINVTSLSGSGTMSEQQSSDSPRQGAHRAAE